MTLEGDESSGYKNSWKIDFGNKEPSELELKLLSVFGAPIVESLARTVLEQKQKANLPV